MVPDQSQIFQNNAPYLISMQENEHEYEKAGTGYGYGKIPVAAFDIKVGKCKNCGETTVIKDNLCEFCNKPKKKKVLQNGSQIKQTQGKG